MKLHLAPNWSALQCKTLNEGLDDHVPLTWGRMRAQYPLPHGPTCSCYITSTLVFLVGSDPAEMQEVIDRVAATLQAAELQATPFPDNFFGGKWLDFEDRKIRSHQRAFLQMFHAWVRIACKRRPSSRRLPKLLGFLRWHVHPRVGSGRFLLSTYCHDRWGNSGSPTPVKILHSLVTVLVQCAEPWKPPSYSKFRLARGMFVRDVEGLDFFGPSIFVDAAWDKFGYMVRGVVPRRGVRSRAAQNRVANQQEAEL